MGKHTSRKSLSSYKQTTYLKLVHRQIEPSYDHRDLNATMRRLRPTSPIRHTCATAFRQTHYCDSTYYKPTQLCPMRRVTLGQRTSWLDHGCLLKCQRPGERDSEDRHEASAPSAWAEPAAITPAIFAGRSIGKPAEQGCPTKRKLL